ncbi:MAG: nucleoside monophosphate kinase [Minisyncoccia bacterium]
MDAQIQKIKAWLGSGSINIFGRPFSGKDTQAHALTDSLGGVVIAGGAILRSYPDQEKIKELSATGELFPIDFYLKVILPFLCKPEFNGKPLILSSVGRWHGEEPAIMKATADSGHPTKAVILLSLTEDDVWQRQKQAAVNQDRGKRLDDTHAALDIRLDEFRNKTMPAIEFYRQKRLLVEVDGTKSRQQVTKEILDKLEELAINQNA